MRRFYIIQGVLIPSIGGGKGGGGGSSSSSQTTNQTDERISATDEAVVISIDEGSSVTLTDPAAQEFLGEVLGDAEALFASVIEFASGESEKSLALVSRALDQSDTIVANIKSQEQQTLEQVVKIAGIVTAGLAAASIFKKG